MLLEVRDICVRYGRMQALSGVSLSVPKGEMITLLGANGAGKSTTLRTISGLLRADSGSITFEGASITQQRPHTISRRGIAHVPEGRGLLPAISVAENLKLGSLGHKNKEELSRIRDQILTFFPVLRERLRAPAGVLSGGEQQMLSIARALLKSPRLLMIDEMSLGLAPRVVEEILQVVVELTKTGMSVLCVEQNTQLILRYASYGYVLETGKTTMEGKAADLLTDEKVVRAYLGRKADTKGRALKPAKEGAER